MMKKARKLAHGPPLRNPLTKMRLNTKATKKATAK
jgi:hypothetical protein